MTTASAGLGIRRFLAPLAALGVALAGGAGTSVAVAAAPSTAAREPRVDDYIVVLDDGTDVDTVAAGHARRLGVDVRVRYRHALRAYAGRLTAAQVQRLAADPAVAYVEPDHEVHAVSQAVPTGVRRVFADDNPAIGIDGTDDRVDVDVAVIDTGIDLDHPDLNVTMRTDCFYFNWSTFSYVCSVTDADDGDDDNGHGTHVAGTIGALDNGIGVVGVAPGARLWAVKVLNAQGSGSLSNVIAGIDIVAAYADDIEWANMSLSCACQSAAMQDAIRGAVDAGVGFAVAAGNSDQDARNESPAGYSDVLTVSALADFDGEPGGAGSATCRSDQDDTLADFSNWGPAVDLAAPGVCIASTWMNGGYATISGTSMAAPHATGAAALLASGANDPQGRADVLAIYEQLRSAGNTGWTDDSGDGIREPLLDVSTVDPCLVVEPCGPGDPPPGPSTVHVADIDATTAPLSGGAWRATARVQVVDDLGAARSGAIVSGQWGTSATKTCTTGTGGWCSITSPRYRSTRLTARFTVTNISAGSLAYDTASNTDPDGDSTGTTITVSRP